MIGATPHAALIDLTGPDLDLVALAVGAARREAKAELERRRRTYLAGRFCREDLSSEIRNQAEHLRSLERLERRLRATRTGVAP